MKRYKNIKISKFYWSLPLLKYCLASYVMPEVIKILKLCFSLQESVHPLQEWFVHFHRNTLFDWRKLSQTTWVFSWNAPNFAGYPATLKTGCYMSAVARHWISGFFLFTHLKKEVEKSKANFIWNKLHFLYDLSNKHLLTTFRRWGAYCIQYLAGLFLVFKQKNQIEMLLSSFVGEH